MVFRMGWFFDRFLCMLIFSISGFYLFFVWNIGMLGDMDSGKDGILWFGRDREFVGVYMVCGVIYDVFLIVGSEVGYIF